MTTIAITGDRSAHPMFVLPVVQQVLLQQVAGYAEQGQQVKVVTGLDTGVEDAVKFVSKAANIWTEELNHATKDWDDYAERLKAAGVETVFFIHGDPASSKLYPALTKVFTDDAFELVNPELLFLPA